jgi:hypothetical protein
MKESIYNHYIEQGNIVVLYNALSDSSLLFQKEIYDNLRDLEIFKNNYPKQYEILQYSGFIIDDDTMKGNYI